MPDTMGTFRVDIAIENPSRPGDRRTLHSVLVDTGAELSWFPADVLESLGIERRKRGGFGKPTGVCWNAGVGPHSSTSPEPPRRMTSYLASQAISPSSVRGHSRDSTSAWIRSPSS